MRRRNILLHFRKINLENTRRRSTWTLCPFFFYSHRQHRNLHSFPTRRSSDQPRAIAQQVVDQVVGNLLLGQRLAAQRPRRSEEHTSELQSLRQLVCRLLLEKKKAIGNEDVGGIIKSTDYSATLKKLGCGLPRQ